MSSATNPRSLAAVGAFFGHLFPVWLRFRGGKGVATYIGILLGLVWPAAIMFCAVWLAVAALTRYSSLAALIASAATPAFLWWRGDFPEAQIFLALSVLLWVMHRQHPAYRGRSKIGPVSGFACVRFAPAPVALRKTLWRTAVLAA